MPFTYILRCAGDYLYIGATIALVYCEELSTLQDAYRRERQLKGWTRRKKEALIAGDLALLKKL
jgi:putative endonuclease